MDLYCLSLRQLAYQSNIRREHAQAIRYYEAIPETSSHYAQAQTGLGGIYRILKDYKRAEQHLLVAVSLAPDSHETSAELAMLLQAQAQFGPAARGWTETLRLNPNYKRGWYELALCLEKLGRKKEALEACRRAYRLSPDSSTVRALMMRLGP